MNLEFFTLDEFNCQVTGENKMEPEFLQKLDRLRAGVGSRLSSRVVTDTP